MIVKQTIKRGVEVCESRVRLLAEQPELLDKSGTLLNLANNIIDGHIHHDIRPFHTCTGRDTVKGPSLTSISKKYWPIIIRPKDGHIYLLLDYSSQEPAICAALAKDNSLMSAYQSGDLYDFISSKMVGESLLRDEIKSLVPPYLYRMSSFGYMKHSGCSLDKAKERYFQLDSIFFGVNSYLNEKCADAFKDKVVRSLDWQATVAPFSNPLSVRNWPVQAASADIMRRACLGLFEAGLDLRLTIHDAFLIRVPTKLKAASIKLAVKTLTKASADVLDGFELKVNLEAEYKGNQNVR